MKFIRNFKRVAKLDGRLVYRRPQLLPVPVKLRSLVGTLKNPPDPPREHSVELQLNRKLIWRLTFTDATGINHVFAKPLVLKRGQSEFRVVITGFAPAEEIEGSVEIDVAASIF